MSTTKEDLEFLGLLLLGMMQHDTEVLEDRKKEGGEQNG